jgi:hypothetical protein
MTEYDVGLYTHPPPFSEGGATKLRRRSTARLPPMSQEVPRLCAPASQRVCLYHDAGAPALVRTIVTNWRTSAYRPDGNLPRPRQARMYARWLFSKASPYAAGARTTGGQLPSAAVMVLSPWGFPCWWQLHSFDCRGYLLSAQWRHGTTSRRSTSLPTVSSNTV